MALPPRQWIDSDVHIYEQLDLWERLPKQFRERVNITWATDDPYYRERLYDIAIDGNPIPSWRGPAGQSPDRSGRIPRLVEHLFRDRLRQGSGMEPTPYLEDMDIEGLDKVVIYPTWLLFGLWLPDLGPDFALALARAYNDYIHDFCAADRARLHPVACVTLTDIAGSIKEVERCAQRGFVGIFVRPNPIEGKTLGHPDRVPLWEACEALGMSVGIHEGTHSYLPTAGSERTSTQAGHHIICHPFEQMLAFLSLHEGHVFDKITKLKFLFLEAGGLWAPYWIHRIDEEIHQYRSKFKGRGAEEVFKSQCYVAVEAGDPFVNTIGDLLGEHVMLMSTDYPHDESTYPNSDKVWRGNPMSEDRRLRVGRLNAFDAYPRLPR